VLVKCWSRNEHRGNYIYAAVSAPQCKSKLGNKNRKWFEDVSQFNYLGMPATNKNLIPEEELNSSNAYYHSVQNLLCSRLLSKKLKIRIYKTIILLVVLYEYETWSQTLREKHGV
jgi:hypothetical protein